MRIIAYYLPQFHEITENNEWWGKGFTEWTSVNNALPLYDGHEQPKVPGELGYYDLSEEEIKIRQATLARDHGIEGFCYWHYWFGEGKRLLEKPIEAVLENKKPDFPFCFGWANESWKAKVWGVKGKSDKLLIEQKYPGYQDIVDHFYACLPYFKDSRYITVDEKPVFVIYKPLLLPDPKGHIEVWHDLARKEGLPGIFFIGHCNHSQDISAIKNFGFDAVNIVRNGEWLWDKKFLYRNLSSYIRYRFLNQPYVIDYKKIIKLFSKEVDRNIDVIPTIIPNWDHTPRSGKRGYLYHNSTPDLFSNHVDEILASIEEKPSEHRLAFLKSWNEWGEGNYMEPDNKFGKSYLVALKKMIEMHRNND